MSISRKSVRERREQLQEIDEIVTLIKNGRWHTVENIVNKSKLPKAKTNEILQFLADYNFITLDSQHRKAKVAPSLAEFLSENQTC